MKIKDMTKAESINGLMLAMDIHENNFNTEEKMATDLMAKIRQVVVETGADMSEEAPGDKTYTGIKNDIEDLIDTIGMNYYIRGMKASAKMLETLFREDEEE